MTAVHVPPRSLEQRTTALRRANEIRMWRAEQKRRLKRGETSALALLAAEDERLETMTVIDLMIAVPKIGRVKAAKILRQEDISPTRTLGALTARQFGALMRVLEPYSSTTRATVQP